MGAQWTRRQVIGCSGVLTGVLTAGSSLALLAPSQVWALDLNVLSGEQGESLLEMGRVLFPHRKLPRAVYAVLVRDLDRAAASSTVTAALLQAGLETLDHLSQGKFVQAATQVRTQVVQSMEGQPFFELVRSKAVVSLYDNEMSAIVFGYPGSSWERGATSDAAFRICAGCPILQL